MAVNNIGKRHKFHCLIGMRPYDSMEGKYVFEDMRTKII